jgi:nitric oxide reductase activation protein
VEELYSTGVLTYCLTLDPQADAYVKRIFGENNYTIVDNVSIQVNVMSYASPNLQSYFD